jgi:hypothetical protein
LHGYPYVEGYKPRGNFQALLEQVVLECLDVHADFFDSLAAGPAMRPPAVRRSRDGRRARRAAACAGSKWMNERGEATQMTVGDIRIVAPYNAHVSRLAERLDGLGIPIGTVDKFQGHEAPVVIYSMATSTPQEAPRGLEFLYSLNRLNVATSRARCAAILVASPHLYVPDCSTPWQMKLANALCRFREMAQPMVSPP